MWKFLHQFIDVSLMETHISLTLDGLAGVDCLLKNDPVRR